VVEAHGVRGAPDAKIPEVLPGPRSGRADRHGHADRPDKASEGVGSGVPDTEETREEKGTGKEEQRRDREIEREREETEE